MRASTDFFVVGMTGLGTALFLTQLLIISQQIVSANNHVQAELAAEKTALPVTWMNAIKPRIIDEGGLPVWHPQPHPPHTVPHGPPPSPASDVGKAVFNPVIATHPMYPERAQEQQIDGYVDFTFILESDGSITDAQVLAEVPKGYGFASAAMRVFPRWKFEPFRENGKALAAPAHYRMRFTLPK